MKKKFILGELFCGPGGIAQGAMNAVSDDGELSIEHGWANDFDPDSCKTYSANIFGRETNQVICKDVRELDIEQLPKITAFAYGFPCNSFSGVGKQQGFENEKFGMLYKYGVNVLKHFQPDWFMAENVSGIRSAGKGSNFQTILDDLEKCGYHLVTHLYKFEDYGIPQARHRIIIIGIRNDYYADGIEYKVPSPDPYKNIDNSSKTALAGIPQNAPNQEKRKLKETVIRRLSYIKPGQNVWQAENLPEDLRIKTRTKISQIYRKLDPEKPAYTVTASGGGGTYMYHWSDENRELTNRERARLQTFPDDYEFFGNYSSVRKQIGMAVPPEGARIILTAVLNSFAGIEYESIPASLK
ncbi:DNA cytosine methyltransferase [Ileibacterium valens]|uniref:DNA cytosine methyltransferase n=1 Tax=Ileibacterium valens TaxID=1862668 RepID=UPI0024BBC980|nr:DNA (cytosine-5-)-methyltransferase [Ileibacterium valens]